MALMVSENCAGAAVASDLLVIETIGANSGQTAEERKMLG